jgi:RecB family exonuclease
MPVGRLPLWRAKKENTIRVLRRFYRNELLLSDELVPTYFEWGFGPEGEGASLVLDLPGGHRLGFRGRVDRVDLSAARVRVIDYKNSGNPIYRRLVQPDQLGRTSFQAPVYQLAAAEYWDRPAQAAFILLKDLKPKWKPTPPTDGQWFDPKAEDGFFARLEQTWTRLAAGDFRPNPDASTCRYCAARLTCPLTAGSSENHDG